MNRQGNKKRGWYGKLGNGAELQRLLCGNFSRGPKIKNSFPRERGTTLQLQGDFFGEQKVRVEGRRRELLQ